MDNDGATVLIAGGTPYNSAAVDKSTIYDLVVDVRNAMTKANVPNDGKRYLLVTPDCYSLMLKDKDNFIRQSDISQEIKATGAIGQYAGFNLYEWNDSTANLQFIAGHPKFATRAEEFSVPVGLYDLSGDANYIGASAVKGRLVYAHKVLRANAVRPTFSPGALVLSAASSDTGKTIVTITGSTGTTNYTLNPTARATYGATYTGGTAITSATTKIAVTEGNIIEVVDLADSKVVSVGYITITSAMIGA